MKTLYASLYKYNLGYILASDKKDAMQICLHHKGDTKTLRFIERQVIKH